MRQIPLVFLVTLFSSVSALAFNDLCSLKPAHLEKRPLNVAVIDTGLALDLEFFKNHLWINPGEQGFDQNGRDKATNGIDDDGNGYIDDVHGWNFAAHNHDLSDPLGHGTHVSGLIVNAGREIRSPAPLQNPSLVRLMVLKYHDGKNHQSRGLAFQEALQYAIQQKADFIHISGGGYQSLPSERRLFSELAKRGTPVVVASGNKPADKPHAPFFPSAYGFPNLISVSALGDGDEPLPTSNESPGIRFLRERGAQLASLLPGNRIGHLTGTSQAAARLSGRMLHLWGVGCEPLSTLKTVSNETR